MVTSVVSTHDDDLERIYDVLEVDIVEILW